LHSVDKNAVPFVYLSSFIKETVCRLSAKLSHLHMSHLALIMFWVGVPQLDRMQ
jgi:hypothetical protein